MAEWQLTSAEQEERPCEVPEASLSLLLAAKFRQIVHHQHTTVHKAAHSVRHQIRKDNISLICLPSSTCGHTDVQAYTCSATWWCKKDWWMVIEEVMLMQ